MSEAKQAPGVQAGEQFLEKNFGNCDTQTRRDAERYRFLRERDLDTMRVGGIFVGLVPDNVVVNGDDLDRAVDQAMMQEAPPFACCGQSADCSRRECPRGRA